MDHGEVLAQSLATGVRLVEQQADHGPAIAIFITIHAFRSGDCFERFDGR